MDSAYHQQYIRTAAIHTHDLSAKGAKTDVKKKQQLDHPPHWNSLILCFGSFMCSLSKSFLCSNLFIWLDRPVVPNGSRCYISILDGLVIFMILYFYIVVSTLYLSAQCHKYEEDTAANLF